MTIDQMRNALINRYPGSKWQQKVRNMDDRQVAAIYKCMEREGRLVEKKWKKRTFMQPLKKIEEHYEQLTIFDILGETR